MTIPGPDRPGGSGPAAPRIAEPSLVRAAGALWRRGDFGVVVLGARRANPVTLSGTGVALWELLEQPRGRGELVDDLATRFGVDRDRVMVDVGPVLDDLLAGGELETVA